MGLGGFFATHDSRTGAITFHNADGLLGIQLRAPTPVLTPGATDLDGAASGLFGIVDEAELPYEIEWGNLTGMTFDSAFAGNVVVPNTLVRAIALSVDYATSQNQVDTVRFIPEPSGMLLTITAATLFAAIRRRSAHHEPRTTNHDHETPHAHYRR